MKTIYTDQPRSAEEYLAPRADDWSDYRVRALAEGEKYLAAIDGILELVRENAHHSEEDGKVADSTVEAMISTGLFRSFTPLQYGGLEMAPAAFYEGVMRIAEADSSAAWIAGQLNIHAYEIALMDKRMQDEFWVDGPDTRASSSYAPIGKWEEVEGGYRLNGTWTFSSGVDHASWVILGGRDRNFVVPIEDVIIDHNSWDVQGLKGTGSKAVTLTDVFVPRYRTHHLIDTYNDQNLGWEVNNRPLYWMSWLSLFNSTPVNTAIGTALDGINIFIEQSRVRLTRQGTGAPAAQNPFLHLKVAESLSGVRTVKQRQLNTWREFFDIACEGKEVPSIDRMRLRYETAEAIAISFESLTHLWPIAGAAASASFNPLQQKLRDLMAARNHGSAGKELAAGQYVKAIFGLEPAPFSDFGTLAFYK
ncbi:Flavin-dependent monooxygenase, oxygenase subunit HsaA [Corynebacterium occultum]|uniref:Flavin-dependent monooxygenase, oxygenase subunit HsaA n=1 Tax=Corynebacterium occultum TaxID=2675219 RepID=A0A6B8VVR3_9CORY|nr:acyl-CoA dehydrogenase [Corynebacterium occultum]QGU08233.1 Flavin-dependent monooxygenase, oxygenase subunit HsaA [Corynebacterium occultum]